MKNIKPRDILVPALTLFLICLAAAALLGLTNSVTAPRILEQSVLAVQKSLQEVVTEVDGVEVDNFSDEIVFSEEDGISYYEAYDADRNVIAYVFTTGAKGYGGTVKVMTAFDPSGTIAGFTVVDCSDETPGLGQNSKTHFAGLLEGKSGELVVDKNSNDGQSVQAITAATITSKAVVSAVNAASEALAQVTATQTEGGNG